VRIHPQGLVALGARRRDFLAEEPVDQLEDLGDLGGGSVGSAVMTHHLGECAAAVGLVTGAMVTDAVP
jgi:hypothetical protein